MSQDDRFGQPHGAQQPDGQQPDGQQPHDGQWQGGQWQQADQTQQFPAYAQQGQPGYGAPAYGQQPGYGAPDAGPYGYPQQQQWQQQPRGTNTMAILGFVFAFVFAPVGIVLSALGLKQVKQRNEGGRGLALAGLIISIVFTVVWLLSIVLLVAAADDATDDLSGVETGASATVEAPPTADDLPLPSDPADPSGPASTAPAGSVAAACDTIIPALTGAQDELGSAATQEEALAQLESLSQQLDAAAAGTDDAGFQADVRRVTDAYRALGRSVAAGGTPDFDELAQAAGALGGDCALAGTTD
ncbi:DUF4190 domain-containing protein [Modestobacter sp. NPDC049651]|uniref:DUF4190 domain-containing protein n=1 Tax=unclassified Modestobacter TaxID=2643866 RepID=UPI0033FBA508